MPAIQLLPGLGADARLFASARDDVGVLEWLPPHDDEPLASYAERFAAVLPDVDVIGGASFGGFVAWELAARRRPRHLVLLGSASSPAAIRGWLRVFLPLAPLLPRAAIGPLKTGGPVLMHAFGAANREQRALLVEMLRVTPPAFMHWAIRAIAGWRPSTMPDDVVVRRLPGARDRIIAPPSEATIVADAGHVVTLTHAAAVDDFLAAITSR